MVTLTPELAGNTIVTLGIVYIVTLIYSIFMAYVGWKQAKVFKQMQEVIDILKEIRDKEIVNYEKENI